jgi:hypothetical protein
VTRPSNGAIKVRLPRDDHAQRLHKNDQHLQDAASCDFLLHSIAGLRAPATRSAKTAPRVARAATPMPTRSREAAGDASSRSPAAVSALCAPQARSDLAPHGLPRN